MGVMGRVFDFAEMGEDRAIWRKLLAEFVSTLLLVLLSCGACVDGWNERYSATLIGAAVTSGLTVAALIQVTGHVSGCHINPVVSLSLMATGKIAAPRAIVYTFIQCMGGTCGALLLQVLTPEKMHRTLGATVFNAEVTLGQGFGVEFMCAFMLMLVISAVNDEQRPTLHATASISVGLTVIALVCSMGMFTGASFNPARTLGPAFVMNEWSNHWVYWLGPIMGGMVGAVGYENVFRLRSLPYEMPVDQYADKTANELVADP